MATYKFKGKDGKTYRFSRQGDATPAPKEAPSAPSNAEKPGVFDEMVRGAAQVAQHPIETAKAALANPKEVGKIALETPLKAAGLAKQGLTGLGVAAQRAIEGKSSLDRTADAMKPGFVPEAGEKIGAFLGPTIPAMATGNIPAAMAIAGATKAGERLNAGEDLSDAAESGAIDAAITGAGAKLIPGALGIVGNLSSKMAQKSFGFSSRAIERLGLDKVKDIATTLAKEKVIDPLGIRANTLANTHKLLARTGEKIGEILDNSGANVQADDVAMTIANKLLPKAKGPLYEKEAKTVQEIFDTVTSLGDGPIPIRALHALRAKISKKAMFNSLSDTEASKIYSEAYGVLSDYLDDAVAKVRPALGKAFKGLNKVYNAAKEGSEAISKKVSQAEAADPGMTLGMGSLAKQAGNAVPGIVSRATGAPVVKEASALARGLVNPARRVTRAGSSQLVNSMLEEEPRKRKEN